MAAAVLLMAAGIAGAQAEDYPARTVTIIVPFAAGGPADEMRTRRIGQRPRVRYFGHSA